MAEHWLPTHPVAGALSLAPLVALADAAICDADSEVVLRAGDWGASFDLDELREDAALGFPLVRRLGDALMHIETRARGHDSIVMHVDGRCLGPAFALAAACDTRIGEAARLGSSEVRYGLPPLLDLPRRLLARLPADVALNVVFHGSVIDGARWPAAADSAPHSDAGDTAATVAGFRPRPIASAIPRPAILVHTDLLGVVDASREDRLEAELEALRSALDHQLSSTHASRVYALMTRDLFAVKSTPPITVLGTGQMGSTIAAATAAAGIATTVVGRSQDKAELACAVAAKALRHLERRGPFFVDTEAVARNLHPATEIPPDTHGVVEAVLEDVEIKRERFAMARRAAPDAWLATTSSSIPLQELGTDIALLHFGFPAEVAPAVEVCYPPTQDTARTEAMVDYLAAIGRVGLEVRSVPGYVVSRLLFAFMSEGVRMCEEGVSPDAVDAGAVAAGFMLGPLGIVDSAGTDLVQRIAEHVLMPAYGQRFGFDEPLARLVDAGALGRAAGRGFYVYDDEGVRPNPDVVADAAELGPETIGERLTLAIVTEAALLARECVAAPAEIDVLATAGVRFPVDSGGPLALLARATPDRRRVWAELAASGNTRLALPDLNGDT